MLLAIIKVIEENINLRGINIDEKINVKYNVQHEKEAAYKNEAGIKPTEQLNQITVLKELEHSVTY